jgi:hypothetical protein
MKTTTRFLLFLLTLSVILLSACSGAPSPSAGDDSNVNDSSVPTVVLDDNANSSGDTNSNNANSNDTNSNSNNGSDDSSNGSDVEVFGVVEAITDDTITINGVTYLLASFTEFKDLVTVGDQVKIHVVVNADGTFTIREIEIFTGDDNGNDNSNSNDANSNDDNGNDSNSNDDNGNDSNSNDNNSNDANSNDDNSNNDNVNNDNGGNNNDDSGSGVNDNDDSGGNDNDSNDNG